MINKVIKELVKAGYTILQVINPVTKDVNYFLVYKWQESYSNNVESIEFNDLQGIDITDFILKYNMQFPNNVQFINYFNSTIANEEILHCSLSKNFLWCKFSSNKVI